MIFALNKEGGWGERGDHPLRGKGEGELDKELWEQGLGGGQRLECK